jgi:hypothetical protein
VVSVVVVLRDVVACVVVVVGGGGGGGEVDDEDVVDVVVTEVTKTDSAFEVTTAPALSVTWSSKDQEPVAKRSPVETEGVDEVVQLNRLPRSA